MDRYSDRLRWAMKHAGLENQSDLARRVGVKQASIWHLLQPAAQKSGLTPQIAQALGVNPDWLATGKGEPLRDSVAARPPGAFYTPLDVMDRIVATALKADLSAHDIEHLKIIDPACGTGAFLSHALEWYRRVEASGTRYDKLAEEFDAAMKNRGARTARVDVILGNPPFREPRIATEEERRRYHQQLRHHLEQVSRLRRPAKGARIKDKESGLDFEVETHRLFDRQGKTLAQAVPFVGVVAAGPWIESHPPYPLSLDNFVTALKAHGPKAYALEVVGESMSQIYKPGDRIIVDPDKPPRAREDDVVVRLHDQNDPDHMVTLKRVMKLDRDPKSGIAFAREVESRQHGVEKQHKMTLTKGRAPILGTVVERIAA